MLNFENTSPRSPINPIPPGLPAEPEKPIYLHIIAIILGTNMAIRENLNKSEEDNIPLEP